MLDAGASLVQLYTGFIYSGPPLVTGLNRAVARRDGAAERVAPDRKSARHG